MYNILGRRSDSDTWSALVFGRKGWPARRNLVVVEKEERKIKTVEEEEEENEKSCERN